MEEQIEEGDVLGTETWNGEYDIAEEEEERLLEEQDATDPGTDQAYYDGGEYEASEVEEDVLDIGLNDDIIEYEEQEISGISPAGPKLNSTTPQQQTSAGNVKQSAGNHSSANTTAQSGGFVKRNDDPKNVQHVLPRKHFIPRQPGFPVRNGIPNQFQQRPNFVNRPPHRPAFNNHQPHFAGRKPSLMDVRGIQDPFIGRMPFEGDRPQFHRPLLMQSGPPVNLLNQQHYLEQQERGNNSGNNRCFINPHYKGSLGNSQGPPPHQAQQRIPPGSDFGPFVHGGMIKGPPQPPPSLFRSGPPSQSLNPPNPPRSRLPNVRFPPPINVPPPQSVGPRGPANSITSRPASGSSNPPQLMDVILVPPVFRSDSGPPFFGERPPRPARFRFDSFPQSDHHGSLGPRSFLNPPPSAHPPIKRPHPIVEMPVAGVPFKQLRPSGPVQSEVFHRPPPVRPLIAPRVKVPLERPPPLQCRPPVTVAPPIIQPQPVQYAPISTGMVTVVKPVAPTTSAPAVPSLPPAPPTEGFVIDKTPSAVPVEKAKDDVPEEMKEYLKKMEEQRKKREEVLRMKEERRRQKLASGSSSAASESQHSSKDTTESLTVVKPKTQGVVSPIQTIQNGQVASTGPASTVSSPESQDSPNKAKLPFRSGVNQPTPTAPTRKTLLVKPTPTVTNTVATPPSGMAGSSGSSATSAAPAAAAVASGTGTAASGTKRRFKIIIIKNKNGDVLEKRYVPIESDESGPSSAANRLVISRPADRTSQTVAIENLNPNSTEKDVRNLCEYFGPVQEIYPKLQEGKAIVRFTSASAAEHFVHNHNTPGICVQFV